MRCFCGLHILVAAMLLAALVLETPALARFELTETFTGRGQLATLQGELERGNYAAAAARVEWLLEEHLDELMAVEGEGRLISLSAWLAALPEAQRAGLSQAYRQRLEARPRRQLQQMRRAGERRPEQWYELARTYPFGAVAAEALVEGAAGAIALGDLSTAGAMYELARRQGWSPPEERRDVVEQLESWRIHGLPVPSEGTWHGPTPFDARWYGNLDAYAIWRFMPYTSDRLTFVTGSRRIAAFRPNGVVHWKWEAPKPWIEVLEVKRPLDIGRGLVWSIKPVPDETGAAQVLVVRQLRSGSIEGCIRAFRASDGKLLWTTDTAEMKPLLVVSEPAVAGRYAYFVAVDSADKGEDLVLAAVEVMTGKLAWRSVIGSGEGVRERKDGNHVLEAFWQQTAPAVDEERVYVAPNIGRVVAVGRFDGKVRWSASYPSAVKLPRRDQWRQYREHRLAGRQPRPPMDPPQLLRWSNTPVVSGEAVVVAPPDTAAAFALERSSGRVLWQDSSPEAPLLLGGSAGRVVFGGADIIARDPHTGEEAWRYVPAGGARVSGPAIVMGDQVHVPLGGRVMTLSGEDGTERTGVRGPHFRSVLAGAQARAVLEEMEAASSFGDPTP